MILGLVTPDAGTASIGGRSYADLPAPSAQVGAVLEATGFRPARSGRDHLRVYCTVGGHPLARADQVLELVGLAAAGRRAVRGYSLGMRQRLALATALLGDPPVLVLDEPTGGLDPQGIAWLRRLLRQFASHGRTVLVSSHMLSEVQQLVDHVVIINHGRLVRQGTLAELSGQHAGVVSVRTPSADELLSALAVADNAARIERIGPDMLRVAGIPAARIGELAFAHVSRLIERHAAALSERIAALQRMRQDLERLARTARTVPPEHLRQAAYCHLIETGVQRNAGTQT